MFLTPESVFVLQFGMALPAAIFVATVLAAPESSFIAQAGITDEAQFLGRTMGGAGRALDGRACRLYGGGARSSLLGDRRAGGEQEQSRHDPRK